MPENIPTYTQFSAFYISNEDTPQKLATRIHEEIDKITTVIKNIKNRDEENQLPLHELELEKYNHMLNKLTPFMVKSITLSDKKITQLNLIKDEISKHTNIQQLKLNNAKNKKKSILSNQNSGTQFELYSTEPEPITAEPKPAIASHDTLTSSKQKSAPSTNTKKDMQPAQPAQPAHTMQPSNNTNLAQKKPNKKAIINSLKNLIKLKKTFDDMSANETQINTLNELKGILNHEKSFDEIMLFLSNHNNQITLDNITNFKSKYETAEKDYYTQLRTLHATNPKLIGDIKIKAEKLKNKYKLTTIWLTEYELKDYHSFEIGSIYFECNVKFKETTLDSITTAKAYSAFIATNDSSQIETKNRLDAITLALEKLDTTNNTFTNLQGIYDDYNNRKKERDILIQELNWIVDNYNDKNENIVSIIQDQISPANHKKSTHSNQLITGYNDGLLLRVDNLIALINEENGIYHDIHQNTRLETLNQLNEIREKLVALQDPVASISTTKAIVAFAELINGVIVNGHPIKISDIEEKLEKERLQATYYLALLKEREEKNNTPENENPLTKTEMKQNAYIKAYKHIKKHGPLTTRNEAVENHNQPKSEVSPTDSTTTPNILTGMATNDSLHQDTSIAVGAPHPTPPTPDKNAVAEKNDAAKQHHNEALSEKLTSSNTNIPASQINIDEDKLISESAIKQAKDQTTIELDMITANLNKTPTKDTYQYYFANLIHDAKKLKDLKKNSTNDANIKRIDELSEQIFFKSAKLCDNEFITDELKSIQNEIANTNPITPKAALDLKNQIQKINDILYHLSQMGIENNSTNQVRNKLNETNRLLANKIHHEIEYNLELSKKLHENIFISDSKFYNTNEILNSFQDNLMLSNHLITNTNGLRLRAAEINHIMLENNNIIDNYMDTIITNSEKIKSENQSYQDDLRKKWLLAIKNRNCITNSINIVSNLLEICNLLNDTQPNLKMINVLKHKTLDELNKIKQFYQINNDKEHHANFINELTKLLYDKDDEKNSLDDCLQAFMSDNPMARPFIIFALENGMISNQKTLARLLFENMGLSAITLKTLTINPHSQKSLSVLFEGIEGNKLKTDILNIKNSTDNTIKAQLIEKFMVTHKIPAARGNPESFITKLIDLADHHHLANHHDLSVTNTAKAVAKAALNAMQNKQSKENQPPSNSSNKSTESDDIPIIMGTDPSKNHSDIPVGAAPGAIPTLDTTSIPIQGQPVVNAKPKTGKSQPSKATPPSKTTSSISKMDHDTLSRYLSLSQYYAKKAQYNANNSASLNDIKKSCEKINARFNSQFAHLINQIQNNQFADSDIQLLIKHIQDNLTTAINQQYNPNKVIYFSDTATIINAPTDSILDDKGTPLNKDALLDIAVNQYLSNRIPVQPQCSLSTDSTQTTEAFKDKARVCETVFRTKRFLHKDEDTSVISVQRTRNGVYVSELHFDPAKVKHFKADDNLRCAVTEINNFIASPEYKGQVIIKGNWPPEIVRQMATYCAHMELNYTNRATNFTPSKSDIAALKKRLENNNHFNINSSRQKMPDNIKREENDLLSGPPFNKN